MNTYHNDEYTIDGNHDSHIIGKKDLLDPLEDPVNIGPLPTAPYSALCYDSSQNRFVLSPLNTAIGDNIIESAVVTFGGVLEAGVGKESSYLEYNYPSDRNMVSYSSVPDDINPHFSKYVAYIGHETPLKLRYIKLFYEGEEIRKGKPDANPDEDIIITVRKINFAQLEFAGADDVGTYAYLGIMNTQAPSTPVVIYPKYGITSRGILARSRFNRIDRIFTDDDYRLASDGPVDNPQNWNNGILQTDECLLVKITREEEQPARRIRVNLYFEEAIN